MGIAAVGVVAGVMPLRPAEAQQARVLTVDAGYDRFFVPGQAVPVRVTIDADRLVSGRLVASWERGDVDVALPVEVPGGSRKSFGMVLPAGSASDDVVTVTLRSGRRTLGRSEPIRLRKSEGDELVGVLPGAHAGQQLPATAPLAVDVGAARFFALTEADLRGAPASVAALGTIGLGPSDLDRLSPTSRAGLLRWVQAGGRLLVDAATGPITGLPGPWQPRASRTAAGEGEILLTSGAMAAGRWDRLVEPTDASLGFGWSMQQDFGDQGIGDRLARVAGLRIPDLGWLIGFLCLYVLLIGPVAFIVLRRTRRAELAWVVVPLAALVFTAGAYGAGVSIRNRTTSAHSTIVLVDAGVATATSYLGLVSHGGGDRDIDLPSGWTLVRSSARDHGADVRLETGRDGARAELPLDAGEFGVIATSGPSSRQVGLEIEATEQAGLAKGTVRNATDRPLTDVIVQPGLGATHRVGPLAPGEKREWSAPVQGQRGFENRFRQFGDDRARPERTLFSFQSLAGANHRRPGQVIAAGWIEEAGAPVKLAGKVEGSTAIVTRAAIRPGAGRLGSGTIERIIVRAPDAFDGGGGDPTVVIRFRMPEGAAFDPASVVLRSPQGAPLEVWADGRWQRTDNAQAPGQAPAQGKAPVLEGRPAGPGDAVIVGPDLRPVPPLPQVGGGRGSALPAGALHDGVLWVRARLGFVELDGSNLPVLEVR